MFKWLIRQAEDKKMEGIHDHDNEISYFIKVRLVYSNWATIRS